MRKGMRTLKTAFPYTIPVLVGYLFIGIAFGILFEEKAYITFDLLFTEISTLMLIPSFPAEVAILHVLMQYSLNY